MVDATWRVQSNSGTQTGVNGPTLTLPNPTQPGSTLLMMAAANTGVIVPGSQSFDPPWSTELPPANLTWWWRRDNQPAGETSWAITGSLSANWAWHVQEWAGLSTVDQPDDVSRSAGTPAFAIITGQQVNSLSSAATPPAADVSDFAGLVIVHVSAGTGVWPAGRSWSSPWSEVASVQNGPGGVSGNAWLLVAEAYPGVSGSLDTTLTWDISGGGTYADKTANMGSALYQPGLFQPVGEVLTA